MLREWQRTRPLRHDHADRVIFEQEAGAAIGGCALLDLDADNACADYRIALNTNARKSYARSGSQEEGRWRECLYRDGEWHEALLMSILALAHGYAEFHAGRDRAP